VALLHHFPLLGNTCTGQSFSQMEERYAVLYMPSMSSKTYFKIEARFQKVIGERTLEEMKETIDEEKQLAIERGDVDENGVPLLTVVADGSWAKRSYKCNYSSLSGMVNYLECQGFSIFNLVVLYRLL
jgi:hypothetical protein